MKWRSLGQGGRGACRSVDQPRAADPCTRSRTGQTSEKAWPAGTAPVTWVSAARAGSAGAPLQPSPLTLGQPAPDAEPLVLGQRVLQALGPDVAATADALGLAGRPALLREEGLRVRLG